MEFNQALTLLVEGSHQFFTCYKDDLASVGAIGTFVAALLILWQTWIARRASQLNSYLARISHKREVHRGSE